ncbi:MAG: flavin reductase family protein [Bacteroidales bacterium]|nr:flavin reductase family protein [Bacteroidales bacterium]
MSRVSFKPGTMIYPLPALMVSCGETPEEYNIATVAWTGTICSDPPMCYISLRKQRHSHSIISRTKEFVLNLTTEKLAKQTDWCGVKSGKTINKFKEMKLTAVKAPNVVAPMIDESPLCIECKVVEIKELGSHDMFIANVVGVHADEKYINKESGLFDLQSAKLMTYSHGKYYSIGEQLGFFGFSVQKKKK